MDRIIVFAVGLMLTFSAQVGARERIIVVGDAVALSYAKSVARQFADHWAFRAPFLEVTGTGVGVGLFCAGVGYEHPDMVATSRPMTEAERRACTARGVSDLTEIEIGRDAVALVKPVGQDPLDLTRAQLYSALARELPKADAVEPNRADQWSQVDLALPAVDIRVMGPEPGSSAESAFIESVMEAGCARSPLPQRLEPEQRVRLCTAFRTDGRYVKGAKREDKVIRWLQDNPGALAVMSFLKAQEFSHRLETTAIEGVRPTPETIRNGKYPLTTRFYLYVKNKHVPAIPGLQQLVYEYTSERAIGPGGYLEAEGYIGLDDIGRNRARDSAIALGTR